MTVLQSPLVSVVIVTWNRRDDVLEAVQSVFEQPYRPVEVVVVDNGSTDDTVAALKEAFPTARLIKLGQNLGASGGRNPGIVAAQGDIIFLLDSDAALSENTLDRVVEKFQANSKLGIIACKILNAYTRQLDQHAGWIYSERDKADQDTEFLSYSFSECGCAVRKEAFQKAGLFWEHLFFGREGEDLSLRIWDAGYEILYYPQAIIYHRASPGVQVLGGEREYYDLRNSLIIYLVRYPWWMLLRFAPLRIGAALFKSFRKGTLRQVVKAPVHVLQQTPSLLRQRQPINNETARRYIGLQREHGPLRWNLRSWLRYKASATGSLGSKVP